MLLKYAQSLLIQYTGSVWERRLVLHHTAAACSTRHCTHMDYLWVHAQLFVTKHQDTLLQLASAGDSFGGFL
jgi:hypothetical protein